MSLCFFSFATVLWGSRWVLQKDPSQCRQDFKAPLFIYVQASHGTAPGWTGLSPLFCPSMSSLNSLLMPSSGLKWKFFLQRGHCVAILLSQCWVMHCMQKLCPHGMVTGSVNKSWHIEHRHCSTWELMEEAIAGERKNNNQMIVQTHKISLLAPPFQTNWTCQTGFDVGCKIQHTL